MKNGKLVDFEQRLSRLEADVKEIKILEAQQRPRQSSWKDFVGVLENDPVAEEARKISDAMRERERRRARRMRPKTKSKP
jgi:hypothetical protein